MKRIFLSLVSLMAFPVMCELRLNTHENKEITTSLNSDQLTLYYALDHFNKNCSLLCDDCLQVIASSLKHHIEELTNGDVVREGCYIGPIIALLDVINDKIDQYFQEGNDCCQIVQADLQELSDFIDTSFMSVFNNLSTLSSDVDELQTSLQALTLLNNDIYDTTQLILQDCATTASALDTGFEEVINLLTTVTNQKVCNVAPITAPLTITQAGSYCLASTMTGSLIINANDVVVDLNGHTLFNGQIIVQDRNNIIIRNGILDNMATGVAAIRLTNCSHIILDTIIINNAHDGIQCNQVTNVVVKNSSIQGSKRNGLLVTGPTVMMRLQDFDIINTASYAIQYNGAVQDIVLDNGNINTTQGIRAELGSVINNVTCRDIIIDATPAAQFPITFLGASSNFNCYRIQVTNAGQGIQFSNLSNAVFEHCSVMNLSQNNTAGAAFRIDAGNNILLDSCSAASLVVSGTLVNDGFKLNNVAHSNLKNCTVESISGGTGIIAGFTLNGCQRITMQNCLVENSIGTQAYGFNVQTPSNITLIDCIVQGCGSHGFLLNGGTSSSYTQCHAANCGGDGFKATSTLNVLYQRCSSNNNAGAGFNVVNALCGNCESNRNSGFGFNGNSSSTAYNCFSGLNTAGAYTAMNGTMQALGAGSPKVGYNIVD